MWSSYNNALVKLNSDGYEQNSRKITWTMRSILTSVLKVLQLCSPLMVIHFLFAIKALRSFLDRNTWGNQLFENALEKTTATHFRIIQSITSVSDRKTGMVYKESPHGSNVCVWKTYASSA